MPHKMRLFVAIDCGELKDYLLQLQKQIPDAELSFAKEFHLTLKFLGEVQPQNVDEIIGRLKNAKLKDFVFHLDNLSYFESHNKLNVLWIGISPEKDVLDLQKEIDGKLKNLFAKERDYKPHITLARVKNVHDKKDFIEKYSKIRVEKKEIKVNGFRLMQSTLASEGPMYEELRVF